MKTILVTLITLAALLFSTPAIAQQRRAPASAQLSVDTDRLQVIMEQTGRICQVLYRARNTEHLNELIDTLFASVPFTENERVLILALCASYGEGMNEGARQARAVRPRS